MTDLERLQKTFTEIGVKYKVKSAKEEFGNEIHTLSYDKETTFDMILELNEGVGYPSFRCDFYFLNGKLANHGCWE